jgi:hypothetical protein
VRPKPPKAAADATTSSHSGLHPLFFLNSRRKVSVPARKHDEPQWLPSKALVAGAIKISRKKAKYQKAAKGQLTNGALLGAAPNGKFINVSQLS